MSKPRSRPTPCSPPSPAPRRRPLRTKPPTRPPPKAPPPRPPPRAKKAARAKSSPPLFGGPDAADRGPRQSWAELRQDAPQHRLHGRGRDRAPLGLRRLALALPGLRRGGLHSHARRAGPRVDPQAADLLQRERPRGG